MLLYVPVLEELHWEDYPYPHDDAGINISLCGLSSCLQKLVIVDLQHFHRADTLRLEIPIALVCIYSSTLQIYTF
jgi:hypothetical protein